MNNLDYALVAVAVICLVLDAFNAPLKVKLPSLAFALLAATLIA